jgi:hypothetical protein
MVDIPTDFYLRFQFNVFLWQVLLVLSKFTNLFGATMVRCFYYNIYSQNQLKQSWRQRIRGYYKQKTYPLLSPE